jgi:PAS domain S-box-containing protein
LKIENGKTNCRKIAKESGAFRVSLIAQDLGYDSDLISGKVYRNEIWSEMLGLLPFEIESSYEGWRKLVHPEDYEIIDSSINSHHNGDTQYNNYEHRLFTKNGEWKWILSLSKIVSYNEKGQAKRLIGIHIDIDDIKHKEIQLKEIAYLLGYSNTESFHRSFKRNTGLSPGVFKQQRL